MVKKYRYNYIYTNSGRRRRGRAAKIFSNIVDCGALCKHHSQNHETQNTNTQTASAKNIFADIAITFAIIHGALVCIIDATTDAVSDIA